MALTPLPPPPSRASSPATFSADADAFLGALPTFQTEANQLASDVSTKQTQTASSAQQAANSATSAALSATSAATSSNNAAANAQNAAAATTAPRWVSGVSYSVGALAWSPINGRIYRRLIAGAGTTDPSNDSVNWVLLSVVVEQVDIGTEPNEIPLNQYLGNMAYMDNQSVVLKPVASASPTGIGEMVFQLTSDTSLTIKVRGRDGTVRSANISLT